jgi:hypothetical protein
MADGATARVSRPTVCPALARARVEAFEFVGKRDAEPVQFLPYAEVERMPKKLGDAGALDLPGSYPVRS